MSIFNKNNQKYAKKAKYESGAGFTLIELIVATTVFLLVVGIAVAIFVSIIHHQRNILNEQQLLNQVSYAEEYMSKALRMAKTADDDACVPEGYIYLLTRPNASLGYYEGLKFINQSDNDACWEFFLESLDPEDPTTPFVLKHIKNEGEAIPLMSGNLEIDFIRFSINGSDGSIAESGSFSGATTDDEIQPRATIILGIKASDAEKIIQTTVSQRNLNIK